DYPGWARWNNLYLYAPTDERVVRRRRRYRFGLGHDGQRLLVERGDECRMDHVRGSGFGIRERQCDISRRIECRCDTYGNVHCWRTSIHRHAGWWLHVLHLTVEPVVSDSRRQREHRGRDVGWLQLDRDCKRVVDFDPQRSSGN